MSEPILLVGSTASDVEASVRIWNAIRTYFADAGLPIEYALYSTYEPMGRALLSGAIDIAWNAPMAHVQSIARSGGACRTLAMRDTDSAVATVIITRADTGITGVEDLPGHSIILGLDGSSELRLLPERGLRRAGIDPVVDCQLVELEPRRYPNLEWWVDDFQIFDAVHNGAADAGAIFEPWLSHLRTKRGVSAQEMPAIWRSDPYNHCAFTARPGLPGALGDRFVELLTAMDPADPAIAEMMKLEHLGRWLAADDSGWGDLLAAVDEAGLVGRLF